MTLRPRAARQPQPITFEPTVAHWHDADACNVCSLASMEQQQRYRGHRLKGLTPKKTSYERRVVEANRCKMEYPEVATPPPDTLYDTIPLTGERDGAQARGDRCY